MDHSYHGSCLCGSIQFEASGFSNLVGNCHCVMCRKFHGSAFSTFVKPSYLAWLSGSSLLKEFTASNGSVRTFCGDCGSSLGWRGAGEPSNKMEIAMSAFNEPIPSKPDANIFTNHKAPWHTISDGLPQYEEDREQIASTTCMNDPDDRVTIAAIQMCSTSSKEKNLEMGERLIREAVANCPPGSPAIKLICLPECFFFIGESMQQSMEAAETISESAILRRYCELARELRVWLSLGGFQEKSSSDADGIDSAKISNAHIIVSPEGEMNPDWVYRKIHLFDAPISNLFESKSTTPGGELVVVDMGFARVGLAICFDLRFPQMLQSLRYAPDLSADIVLMPSAFTVKTGKAHWRTLIRARAIENQVMMVAAAQSGVHNSRRVSYGHTLAVDAWGTVVGDCGEANEGVCYAQFSKSFQNRVREGMPVQETFTYTSTKFSADDDDAPAASGGGDDDDREV